jgi:flagellar hook-associated protein 2
MAEISSISFSIDALVQQYRSSQRKPAVVMENKKTTLNARLKVLADLKTKLSALFSTVKDLSLTGTSSKFLAYSVSSSLTSVAIATASSSAAVGSHTLLVTQLAKADTVLSSKFTSSATTVADAEGAGNKQLSLTTNGTTVTIDVSVAAGQSNSAVLSAIASAVNASTAGVSASVVSDTSTTSRLVLTSKQTGSAQAVSLGDVSGTLLSNIGLTAGIIAGRTASTSTAAGFQNSSTSMLDSNFKLDGIDIERGSNSVSDALTGVTLELKAAQQPTDAAVTLTVGFDKEKVRTQVEKFITDYNAALDLLNSKTSVDAARRTREILAGDTVFLNMRSDIRAIGMSAVSSVSVGNPSLLSGIGIEAGSDGTLSVKDSVKLDDAITTDVKKVSDLFNSSGGIAVQLNNVLDGFVTFGGQMDASSSGVKNQVSGLDARIKRFDERLERKVAGFRAEFLRIQDSIAAATRQQQIIQSLMLG